MALRRCVLGCLVAWGSVTLVLFYFRNPLFNYVTQPFIHGSSAEYPLIATSVISVFTTPLKVALLMGLMLAMPVILYQLWRFILPGLYPDERKKVWQVTLISVLLFGCGVLFCFWLVLPLIFQFMAQMVPAHVAWLPDIQQYIQFCLQLLLAFGLAFQAPIAIRIMVWLGIVDLRQLIQARPYVIVLAFVLGMLLTPPDVISQILFAAVFWGLFEISVFILKWQTRESNA